MDGSVRAKYLKNSYQSGYSKIMKPQVSINYSTKLQSWAHATGLIACSHVRICERSIFSNVALKYAITRKYMRLCTNGLFSHAIK